MKRYAVKVLGRVDKMGDLFARVEKLK